MDLKLKLMKEIINIKEINEIDQLESEYDLQKALLFDRKLRLLVKEDKSLVPIHIKLIKLIHKYEKANWSDGENVSNEQVKEAEKAEKLVEIERKFIQNRKEIIRQKLKSYDMNQQDLGVLLGHSKSYMSELINGVTQFSLKDLIIIHKILNIKLQQLIPTYLQNETRKRVKESIKKLNKPKLRLRQKDLILD